VQAANWQLQHVTWTFKDGAPENVMALEQTADGFLWLGGYGGLYRFDGKQFELFRSPFGEELLSTNISSLYALPSGGLWIGYTFGGASFIDKGRVTNYGGEFATSSGSIRLMTQDKDGIVWAAGSGGLWRFEHSHWERIGREWNVPLKSANEVALDRDGNLWVNGGGMLLRLPRRSRRFEIVQRNIPDTQRFSYTGRLLDREGNIWFSSTKGVDRFYYSPLVKQESLGGGYVAIAADVGGKVWVGEPSASLYHVAPGETRILPKYPGWTVTVMYRAPDSTIWLGGDTGLWHETLSHRRPLRGADESDSLFEMRKALWSFTGRDWLLFKLPHEVADQGKFLQAITQDPLGRMWVSLGRHGLYSLANGVWTPYAGLKELPTTGVVTEFTDNLGRVWFGFTRSQLAFVDGDGVQVFGPNQGIHIGNIMAIHGRGPRIWIGGEFGLQQFDAGRVSNINAVNNEWLRGISGITETANGDLWLNGSTGIFHIPRSELEQAVKDPSYRVKGNHFDRRNGLPGFATQIRPLPSAIEGTDGRLWFTTTGGVVWVDPGHPERSAVTPRLAIESVSANGKFYLPGPVLRFPPHTADVQIAYSAVSLSNPEAIRFRYKLQETDKDWHEVSTAEPVTYRNLAPGSYHFSLNATNTNGVWSDAVATSEFTILPAFYQTRWFVALCVVSALAFLYMLYVLRVRQLARQLEVRMEERVGERTRIARELHDTLLQSFQGVLMKFHAAARMIRNRPDEAEKILERAIEQAGQAVTEGRDAVQALRSSTVVTNDLARAIRTLGAELADQGGSNSPDFRVDVEGTPRDLAPIVRDNVYRVVGEGVRNAFQHARAKRIEVEIRYDHRQLRLRVRDDGKGIDPEVLESGARAGHYGLPGLQERAKLVGGKLTVRSERDSGTEIELSIPASIVYASAKQGPRNVNGWKSAS
jgi:signal transduction histidine kinase/ligand-binding sensor domain-containing protein